MGVFVKRFKDTRKWEHPWFGNLTPIAKLLWEWLNDHCDNAGVINPNFKLASFQIGETVNEQHIAELKNRLQEIEPGTYWILGFIEFQFGRVPAPGAKGRMAPLHASIWNSIAAHKLDYNNPSETSSQSLDDPSVETSVDPSNEPSPEPSARALSKGEGKGEGKKPNLVWKFMVGWKRLYFKRFNVVYSDKKRDFSAVKVLLKATQKQPEELIKVALDAWDKSGYGFWACENRTREICDFCNGWNKINAELYAPKTHQRNSSNGSRPVADRNAGTLNDPDDYKGITSV